MAGMPWEEDDQTAAPQAPESGPWNTDDAGASTTPYQVQNKPQYSVGNARFGERAFQTGGATPDEMQQAQSGVDVDTGAPVSYLKGSLSVNQKAKDAYYSAQLKQQGLQTRIIANKLQYFNPSTKRWTLVEPNAKESLVGGAIDATGEIAGGTAGAVAGAAAGPWGAVAGGAGGAAVGGFLADYAKAGMGALMGVNDLSDLGAPEAKAAATEGAVAGASDLVLGGLGIGLKGAGRFLFKGGPPIAADVAAKVEAGAANYAPIIQDINSRSKGGFQPSLAKQAFMDPTSMEGSPEAADAVSKQMGLSKDPKYFAREVQRNQNNESVLLDFYKKNLVTPYADGPEGQLEAAQNVKSTILAVQAQDATPAQEKALQAAQMEEQQLKHMNQPLNPGATGDAMRNLYAGQLQERENMGGMIYDTYRNQARYAPDGLSSEYQIPVQQRLIALQRKFNDKLTKTLLPQAETAETRRYLMDLQTAITQPSFQQNWNTYGSRITPTLDLAQVENAIKFLNQEDFASKAGHTALMLGDKDRADLLSALKDTRGDFFEAEAQKGNPGLRDAHQEADSYYTETKHTYDRELLGTILKHDGKGGYLISAPQVLDKMLSERNEQIAQQAGDLLKRDPVAQNQFFQYLQAVYTRNYTKQDAVTGARSLDVDEHRRFLNEIMPTANYFLTPDQSTQIRKLGGVAYQSMKTQQDLDTINKVFTRSTAGKFGQMRPETLVKAFNTTKAEGTDIGPIIASVRAKFGEAPIQQWQRAQALDLKKQIYDPTAKKLDLGKLNTYMTKNEDKIKLLYGEQYHKDLTTLRTGLATNRLEISQTSVPSKSTVLSDIGRVAEGPMTPLGRARTSLFGFRQRAYLKSLESALYNPTDLHNLAIRYQKDSVKARSTMGGIVTGTALLQNDIY